MSDFDRELVDLISDVTDGEVDYLSELVEKYGPALVNRVFSDGFGVVFLAPNTDNFHAVVMRALGSCDFLATEEVFKLIAAPTIDLDYRVHGAPGAVGVEEEPNLIFRYAADDPDAIAKVRRLNTEQRGPAERERRESWERWGELEVELLKEAERRTEEW